MRQLLFALCAIALSQGAAAQSQEGAPQAEPTIETGRAAASDRDIDRRLEEIFDEIDGLGGVSASVNAGVITLRGEVAERALAEQAEALAKRIDGVVAVRNEISETVQISRRLTPVFDRMINRSWQLFNYLPLFIVAFLVFCLISIAGWWIAARTWPWQRITPNAFIADLVRQAVRLAFAGFGLVLALDILGATALLGTIVGAAGIVGLAVGFAVRDTVENYIASILLSIRQPFRPNDHILIDGFEGHVARLTSRATILLSMDGNHIRIPNAAVFKSVITNYSRNPERRFTFELGIDADSNASEAVELGLQTLADQPFVLNDPGPDAWIKEVGDSNIVIWYSGWVDQDETNFARARSEAIRLTKRALENNGFSLPEPIYRLRIEDAPAIMRPASPAAEPGQKPPPDRSSASPESGEAGNTSADDTVKKMVDEERSVEGLPDLLDENAPAELE